MVHYDIIMHKAYKNSASDASGFVCAKDSNAEGLQAIIVYSLECCK